MHKTYRRYIANFYMHFAIFYMYPPFGVLSAGQYDLPKYLKDFTCELCSDAFISKDSLLNHEKSVHTENIPLLEEFTCKLCSEVFINKDILLNHEQFVHTDDLTESNCDEIQKEVDLNSYK
jgi:hypothetical protein